MANLCACRFRITFARHMSYLEVHNLSYSYPERKRPALSQLTLELDQSKVLAISGESGSGKSTFLHLLSGLMSASEGEIFLEGQKVEGYDLIPGQEGVKLVSQQYDLDPYLMVEEIVRSSFIGQGLLKKEINERTDAILGICRMSDFRKVKAGQLSGGQQQRVALARALVDAPGLLLLDEPFSHLDRILKEQFRAVLTDLNTNWGITMIIVTHDAREAISLADQLLILKDGELQQLDTPLDVYRSPVSDYTAGLMGPYNRMGPSLATKLVGKEGVFKRGVFGIRPEDISIEKTASDFSGRVKQVRDQGPYREIQVGLHRKITLDVATWKTEFKEGDAVALSVPKEKVFRIRN